jgi:hypothetical protein
LKPVCVCRSGYEEEEVEAVCEVPGRRLPPKDPVTQFNARTTQYVNSTLLRYYYKAKHIKPVSLLPSPPPSVFRDLSCLEVEVAKKQNP